MNARLCGGDPAGGSCASRRIGRVRKFRTSTKSMPVSTIASSDDVSASAGSTPLPRPPRRTGTGMLTLGWAVDQSRRVLRARSSGKKVHPDGGIGTPKSRGSDGTQIGTPSAAVRSPRSPRRPQPPGKGNGTCLHAVMQLMGFGRREKKVLDAAGRMVKQSRGDGWSQGKSPGKHRRATPLASTPENGVGLSGQVLNTPDTSSNSSRHGESRKNSSRHEKKERNSSSRRESRGDFGAPPASRSASMRHAPHAGDDNMWQNPSPASRGVLVSNGSSILSHDSRFGDDGWNALRDAQARRELFN